VAQRAETCLMCGAYLKEQTRWAPRLTQSDLTWPMLLILGIVVLWLWKPWQADEPQALAPATAVATATATARPTAAYVSAPTATPLVSPTPTPTATLPPNQTRHTVEANETVSTIAKKYGATTDTILQANGLKANSILSVGQELIIPLPLANTSTPTVSPTPSPTPFEYTVKTGDYLSEIAKRYKTTVEALMQANGIADATNLRAGTKLIIVQPPDYSATMAYETYEVQQGDTLYTIAADYGVSVDTIKEVNKLTSDSLKVGQDLRIPVGTATPVPTLTPTITPTPTPGPPWPAPLLLAPPDGASFEGEEAAIVLNWASVGILAQDEWYVLRLRRAGPIAQQLPAVWTKATSWRLPAELYLPGLEEPQQFYWHVTILRQTGTGEDEIRTGEMVSPATPTRILTWK
jgi:LysM repeat protein